MMERNFYNGMMSAVLMEIMFSIKKKKELIEYCRSDVHILRRCIFIHFLFYLPYIYKILQFCSWNNEIKKVNGEET